MAEPKHTFEIKIEIPEEKRSFCEICQKAFKSPNALAGHIGAGHKIEFSEYLIKYYNNNVPILCKVVDCNKKTKYVRGQYSFKQYCIDHADLARIEWSKLNGFGAKQDAGWQRGLTKETNEVIRQRSERMKGEGNIFFGKKHSEETKLKLSALTKLNPTSKITEEDFHLRKNGIKTICLSDYSEYTTASEKNLRFKCLSCDDEFIGSLYSNNCKKCIRTLCLTEDIRKKLSHQNKLDKIEFNKRIDTRNSDFRLLSSYELDYFDQDDSYLKFECLKCNKVNEKTLTMLINGSLCKYCQPYSKEEMELGDFLSVNNVQFDKNKRNVIPPKELDILIESHNLAIEYNGLYWHTEKRKGGANYHSDKTKSCKEKNIKLIQIFSDEWIEKKDIVKSMLSHKLGLNKNIIQTRNCKVEEASLQNVLSDFFNKTHIAGHTQYTKAFYLTDNNEIVAALSLRKPFIKKHGENTIEIARYSTKLNTSVPGGFSRLLKYAKEWASQNGYKTILSYADLRYGTGNVYEQNGFKFIGQTVIDYWYTDGKHRFNRFKFRAQNGKSEKEIAQEAGVEKIFGCGSNIYLLDLQPPQN